MSVLDKNWNEYVGYRSVRRKKGVRRGDMMKELAGHNKDENKKEKYAQNYSAVKI